MRRHLALVLGCGLMASLAAAQTATPNQKLAWDQVAPDLATASAYTYKLYADGAATSTTLAGVTCVAGAGVTATCAVAVPAFTPGSHSVTITATNAAGESPQSAPFAFTMVLVPSAPTNIRVQ